MGGLGWRVMGCSLINTLDERGGGKASWRHSALPPILLRLIHGLVMYCVIVDWPVVTFWYWLPRPWLSVAPDVCTLSPCLPPCHLMCHFVTLMCQHGTLSLSESPLVAQSTVILLQTDENDCSDSVVLFHSTQMKKVLNPYTPKWRASLASCLTPHQQTFYRMRLEQPQKQMAGNSLVGITWKLVSRK